MPKRIIKLIVLLSILLILCLLYIYLIITYNFYIPCLFHKLTGYYCPGCGITRCILYLLQGNIYKSFRSNQLVFIMLPFIMVYIIYKIYLYIFDKKDNIINKIPNTIWTILLVVTILFGILRNIEYFNFLTP